MHFWKQSFHISQLLSCSGLNKSHGVHFADSTFVKTMSTLNWIKTLSHAVLFVDNLMANSSSAGNIYMVMRGSVDSTADHHQLTSSKSQLTQTNNQLTCSNSQLVQDSQIRAQSDPTPSDYLEMAKVKLKKGT